MQPYWIQGQECKVFWAGVKFPETDSSPRHSYFQEISGKYVLPSQPRPKKSGIEYVILAGSSLFSRCRGVNPDMGRVWRLPGGGQRTIFSKILTFFALQIAKFSLAYRGFSRF